MGGWGYTWLSRTVELGDVLQYHQNTHAFVKLNLQVFFYSSQAVNSNSNDSYSSQQKGKGFEEERDCE